MSTFALLSSVYIAAHIQHDAGFVPSCCEIESCATSSGMVPGLFYDRQLGESRNSKKLA